MTKRKKKEKWINTKRKANLVFQQYGNYERDALSIPY